MSTSLISRKHNSPITGRRERCVARPGECDYESAGHTNYYHGEEVSEEFVEKLNVIMSENSQTHLSEEEFDREYIQINEEGLPYLVEVEEYIPQDFLPVEVILDTPNGIPILVGAPGVGKTSVIEAWARKNGYTLITIIGSQQDPTDIGGIPQGREIEISATVKEFGTVKLMPDWQITALEKGKVLVFFDEYSNTPPLVRNAMLNMLTSRKFPNGTPMPSELKMIAAMNPSEQTITGDDLGLTDANRFQQIPWEPPVSSWIEGTKKNWGRPASPQKQAHIDTVTAFIAENPSFLQRLPEEINSAEAYASLDGNSVAQMSIARTAWASGRSWTNFIDTLVSAEKFDLKPDSYAVGLIAQGSIAQAAHNSLARWYAENGSISWTDALANPKAVKWENLNANQYKTIMDQIESSVSTSNVSQVMSLLEEVVVERNQPAQVAAHLNNILTKATTLANTSGDSKLAGAIRQRVIKLLPHALSHTAVNK